MTKARPLDFGHLFGLGILSVSGFACSGSAFTSGAPAPEHTNTSDKVVVPARGPSAGAGGKASTTTTGGTSTELEGGAPGIEPEPAPGGYGGAAGASTTAGAGGAGGEPPEEGGAGERNIPDPPIDPNCAAPIVEAWNVAIDSASSDWEVEFGDPWVDTEDHRLVVTYDDVASRKTAYEGGYYVTTEVTLEGGTVLTPYPYANELRWPSLRRSADGSSIELGADEYGITKSWSNGDWPGFSGTVIAGTKTVLLTTYVKAAAQALAVKVSYGGHSYRSGWVSGFTWAKTNLGILRYVGENNSRVYAGDAVYVGPLSGCEKMSDAAVQALFAD